MASEDSSYSSSLLSPSHSYVTSEDHTSLLNVMGWFSVVIVVLIVLARLGTRWAKSRRIAFDDGAIVLSTIFAIAQTTIVSLGVSNGLGRFTDQETDSQLAAQQKAIYAFTILFVLGQFFAKLSVTSFIMALTPYRTHKLLSGGLIAIACVWMITSVLGFALQCKIPYTWMFIHNECIDRLAFYTFVEIFNILLDTTLAVFPSFIIIGLQLDTKRKAITVGFFLSRLFVVAASIVQLVIIYSRTEDPFLSWTFALLVMIIQTLGIVTACGPYLRPFLESVNSGMIGNDDIRRREGGKTYRNYGTQGTEESRWSKRVKIFGALTTRRQKNSTKLCSPNEQSELDFVQHSREPRLGQMIHKSEESDWEVGSQTSRARIMRQMPTYEISSETREPVLNVQC